MKDFIHLYNPNNATNLTEQEIAAMQELTDDQIRELAERYPNHSIANTYLLLKDMSAKTQIYPASTWQNLYNLRVKNGMKKYIPFTFKSIFIKRATPVIPIQEKVQDLTQNEIDKAEGIKKIQFKPSKEVKNFIQMSRETDENGGKEKDEFPELTVPVKKKRGPKPKNITNN